MYMVECAILKFWRQLCRPRCWPPKKKKKCRPGKSRMVWISRCSKLKRWRKYGQCWNSICIRTRDLQRKQSFCESCGVAR